jgi:hypothetical protein
VDSGGNVALATAAPAALRVELLDEQGPAMVIASAQAPQLAAAVASAVPGQPQLPPGFVVLPGSAWQPPPSSPPVTGVGPWPKPSYCVAKDGWKDGKVPPAGEAPLEADGGSLDATRTGQTGQNLKTSGDGCTAGRSTNASNAGVWLALAGVWVVAWRRRDRSCVSLTPVSSKR